MPQYTLEVGHIRGENSVATFAASTDTGALTVAGRLLRALPSGRLAALYRHPLGLDDTLAADDYGAWIALRDLSPSVTRYGKVGNPHPWERSRRFG